MCLARSYIGLKKKMTCGFTFHHLAKITAQPSNIPGAMVYKLLRLFLLTTFRDVRGNTSMYHKLQQQPFSSRSGCKRRPTNLNIASFVHTYISLWMSECENKLFMVPVGKDLYKGTWQKYFFLNQISIYFCDTNNILWKWSWATLSV